MCEEGFSHSSNNLAVRAAIVVRRAGLLENLLSSTKLAKVSSSLNDSRMSIVRKSLLLISAPFPHIGKTLADVWVPASCSGQGGDRTSSHAFSLARPVQKLFTSQQP